jgi:hypothetical protein
MIMPKKANPTTSTERMRRKKERELAGIVLPECKQCGAKCTAEYTIMLQLCSRCYMKTPEGRKKAIANTVAYRRRKRLSAEHLHQLEERGVPRENISLAG